MLYYPMTVEALNTNSTSAIAPVTSATGFSAASQDENPLAEKNDDAGALDLGPGSPEIHCF